MRVVVGRVGRPHGVSGEVSIQLRTDDPGQRFAPGATLTPHPADRTPVTHDGGRAALTVSGVRPHGARLLVTFAEVTDRGAAEALTGMLLTAEVGNEPPEDPAEFYDHQLVGLRVVTSDGRSAGVVSDVIHLPAQDLLAVRTAAGAEALVPFVAALVPEVDVAAGKLVVEDRPGLLDSSSAEV